jgi:hypothetical protein
MQALHHSATSNHCTLDEMDGLGRQVRNITRTRLRLGSQTTFSPLLFFVPLHTQMLLVDPSIQRAFDRIDCTPTSCGSHHVTFNPGEDVPRHSSPSSTGLPHKIDRPSTTTAPPSTTSSVTTIQQATAARPCHHPRRSMEEYVFEWKRVFTVDGLQHYNYLPSVYSSVLSASILFNQAVILHTGGVPKSRRALERALTLYSMAAKRLFEGCPRHLLMADEYTTTLTCAVLNNTGYLLHQMGEYGGSQLCFTRMNEFLHQLGPSQSIHEKRRRDEFGLNILIFWRPLSGAASA